MSTGGTRSPQIGSPLWTTPGGIDRLGAPRGTSRGTPRGTPAALVGQPRAGAVPVPRAPGPSASFDPCPSCPHRRAPTASPASGPTTATTSSTTTSGCATRSRPTTLAYLEAENAYTEAADRPPRRPARDDLRGDQVPHPGDRPVGARPDRRLVVLRPLLRGAAVRPELPLPGRATPTTGRRRSWRRTRRRPRRGGAARRQRAGRGTRVLLARHGLGQPRRHPAGLLDRHRRRRAVPAARQGPAHRRAAARRGPQHARRRGRGTTTAPRSSTPPSTRRGVRTRCGGTRSGPRWTRTCSSTTRPTSGSGRRSAAAAATGCW